MRKTEQWKPLDQVATFTSGGTPSKSNPEYWNGHIPWVSAKDMKSARVIDTEDHISEQGLENGTRLAPAGATLVLVRGMTLLNDVPICISARDVAFNQDIKALIPKDGVVSAYLNYAIRAAKPEFLASVDLAGHGTGKLPTDIFKLIKVRLPDEDEQRAIAHILGTLDDKIELNRRMNETLEAMARAIFQSWFVDFDPVRAKASGEPAESVCQRLGLTPELLALFPDSLEDSELGEIPNGWCIRKVEDIALKIGMGPFGSNIKVSTFVNDGVPVVSGQHVKEVMLDDNTYKFISVEHADRLSSANVGCGDVIFTHAGNIGQVSYIPDHSKYERYVLSQRQFYLRCDSLKVSHLFMTYYFRSPLGQHLLLANASQVGVPSIARPVSYLKTIKLAIPPRNILDRFDGVVRSFHHRVSANRTEIGNLATVRDSLLTVLLSGDVPTTTQRSH